VGGPWASISSGSCTASAMSIKSVETPTAEANVCSVCGRLSWMFDFVVWRHVSEHAVQHDGELPSDVTECIGRAHTASC